MNNLSFETVRLFYCILGLADLIDYYKQNKTELPTRLAHGLTRHIPPPFCLKRGYTNILHKAIDQGNYHILLVA